MVRYIIFLFLLGRAIHFFLFDSISNIELILIYQPFCTRLSLLRSCGFTLEITYVSVRLEA